MYKKLFMLLLVIISIIIMLSILQNKKNHQKPSKDWSSYINSRIGDEPHELYKRVMKYYLNKLDQKEGYQYRAVNFGSGAGQEDIQLINKGWEVLSVDSCPLSSKIITEKTKNSKGTSITFQGDFLDAKLIGEYDLIMSFYSLPFGKKQNLSQLLQKINKHLKKRGLLIANFFGEEHDFVKNKAAYGISQKELLIKLLDNGFKIIEFKSKLYKASAFSSAVGEEVNWDVLEVIAKKD